MSFFVSATPAPQPKTTNIRAISLLSAAVITVMVVAQLFSFEDFPAVIASLWLPGGEVMAHIFSAVLVVCEVFMLPFLLSLPLSQLFRVVSMVLGWTAALLWLFLALWENITTYTIPNSGILGATVPLPVGWWSVFYALALASLVAWVSWGMWPKYKRGNTWQK
jgi:hypothetical protein